MSQAHSWTKEQADSAATPNYSKLYVVKPNLLALLGHVKGKKVLELGCGNGFWLEILNEEGAQCFGIDNAKHQIELAQTKNTKNQISYECGSVSDLLPYPDSSFDVVFLEHVLLEIDSITKIKKICSEAYRVLKSGGTFVVSDFHPFGPFTKNTRCIIPDSVTYDQSGTTFQIVSKRIDGKETYYTDFHWTLEDLAQSICNPGFKITNIKECRPTEEIIKEFPYLAYRRHGVGSIMIQAIK